MLRMACAALLLVAQDDWKPLFNGKDLEGWTGNISLNTPAIHHNPTNETIISGGIFWGPNEVTFHPGPSNQQAVVRFTVPNTGVYSIETFNMFRDLNHGQTDVHVFINGASIPIDNAYTAQ